MYMTVSTTCRLAHRRKPISIDQFADDSDDYVDYYDDVDRVGLEGEGLGGERTTAVW